MNGASGNRRVVVTGMGIVSCLGNDQAGVEASLRTLKAGIRFIPEYAGLGLRSQVAGQPEIDLAEQIDRKLKRFMGDAAAYAYVSMRDAIADAGVSDELLRGARTGLIAGSGGGSPQWQIETGDLLRNRGVRKVGPYMVPRTMGSTVSAALSTAFGIRGISYSISAACATSAHCIGAAANMIRHGAKDVMFAGGGEELHWGMTAQFDAMGALSTHHNDTPGSASRPYDAGRDGFVLADGAGVLLLEEYEAARARGANILAELVGYGMSGDAYHMTAPSEGGEGGARCMVAAIRDAGVDPSEVGYINVHGTSTPQGDLAETMGIKSVLGDHAYRTMVSSTKSMTGHLLGAAGGVEAVFSTMALHTGVIPPTINLDNPSEGCDLDYVPHTAREKQVDVAMSNSFGFGGTNGSLVFRRV